MRCSPASVVATWLLLAGTASGQNAPAFPHGNGTNCAAGNYARGTDEYGNAEECTGVSAVGGAIIVEEDDGVTMSIPLATALDFLGTDFNVSESPAGEANISLVPGLDTGPIPDCIGTELQDAAGTCVTNLAELNTSLGTGLVTGAHTADEVGVVNIRQICAGTTGPLVTCTTDTLDELNWALTTTIADGPHTTDTVLTQEQVEDYVGTLVTDGTGTHTDITVTYQDATGDVDIVVDTLPNLTGTLTDAQVSDTLTASLFVGSGSTTTAIDLATAEVAGSLASPTFTGVATTADLVVEEIFDIGTKDQVADADCAPNVSGGTFFGTSWSAACATWTDLTGGVAGQIVVIEIGTGGAGIVFDCTAAGFDCGTADIRAHHEDVISWVFGGDSQWHLVSWYDGDNAWTGRFLGTQLLSATNNIQHMGAFGMQFNTPDGAAEKITLELDNANEATWSTSTGVTQWNFAAMSLITTGTMQGNNEVKVSTGDYAIATTEIDGTFHVADHTTATSDLDYTLPTAVTGAKACFYDNGGGTGGVIIDASAGDEILLYGTGVGVADAIDSPGVAGDGVNGDYICLLAIDATYWVSLDFSGTWVDGGVD